MVNQGVNMSTKNLRKTIRKIILENVSSSAKGINDLQEGIHELIVNYYHDGVTIELWFKGDEYLAARCTTSSTNNEKVDMIGALYIEDDKANLFGPFLSDLAMELTTKNGKWLAMDRSSASEDAQKLWQYYLDKRLDIDVQGLQLDDKMNTLTKTRSDNIDSQMADEVMMGFGSGYWSADDQKAYQADFYRTNALMWAFKKEPKLLSALAKLPNIFQIG